MRGFKQECGKTGLYETRRDFLMKSCLGLTSTFLLPSLVNAEPGISALAQDAFIWGVPLVLTGRYLDIAANAGIPFNHFVLSPNLATPNTRALGPQVDTLYGLAWIDLVPAPQVIEVPDTHDRYYSIQLLDAYADSFAYIGRRATGTHAGAFVLTPPGFTGSIPDGIREIKAPTSKVLAFVRTLVRSTGDLPAARAIHSSYTLGALGDYPDGRHAGSFRQEAINLIPVVSLDGAGAGYFDDLNRLVEAYPPLPWDAANLARFAPLGVGPGETVTDPAVRVALDGAVPAALLRIRQESGSNWTANGWTTKLDVTNVIRDPLRRAAYNLYGPGTHVAEEAVYFSARTGPDGKPLTGANRYRLRFPPGQTPPVNAFWSVGMYTKDLFLFDNPIHRYSVTDRTAGLHYGSDGSLDILIQHDQPAEGPANWLPAPADTFLVAVRAYQPRPEILNRTYKLPPLELL